MPVNHTRAALVAQMSLVMPPLAVAVVMEKLNFCHYKGLAQSYLASSIMMILRAKNSEEI